MIRALLLLVPFLLGSQCGGDAESSSAPAAALIFGPNGEIPIHLDNDWLVATSLVDANANCPPAAKPIYRGSFGGFFTLANVIRNMLGDETAEYRAWRLSSLLKATSENWQTLKRNTIIDFQNQISFNLGKYPSDGKCVWFAHDSERDTWENNKQAQKEKSWGIAGVTDYNVARNYGSTWFSSATAKPGESMIFEIVEKVPRAALTTKSSQLWGWWGSTWPQKEFYFPIVIPAADIMRAWSGLYQGGDHAHGVEKIETSDGKWFKEIRIYREAKLPKEAKIAGVLEGRIVPCLDVANCVSDPLPTGDLELEQMVGAIPLQGVNGYRFKFVAESVP